MQEVIEKLNKLAEKQAELDAAFSKWKDNNGTITVEVIKEVVKEVPVEVIKEVEKLVEPDTTEMQAKLVALTAKLEAATAAVGALTSVAPVAEKAADVVGEAIIDAAEAKEATPATDAFVKTEPDVVEETAATLVAEAVAEAKTE
jgi:molybdate-binding protein